MPRFLADLIRRFEGLFLKPYLCPAKVPTVGYGSTAYEDGRPVKMTDPPITTARAESMMLHDAELFARAAGNLSPILYQNEARHAAIADFCYNLGTTRYKASTLRRRVERGDWNGAAEELQKWVWGGGKKLPGLVARRQAEAALLRQS